MFWGNRNTAACLTVVHFICSSWWEDGLFRIFTKRLLGLEEAQKGQEAFEALSYVAEKSHFYCGEASRTTNCIIIYQKAALLPVSYYQTISVFPTSLSLLMSSHLGGDVLDILGTTILISFGADASMVRKKKKIEISNIWPMVMKNPDQLYLLKQVLIDKRTWH